MGRTLSVSSKGSPLLIIEVIEFNGLCSFLIKVSFTPVTYHRSSRKVPHPLYTLLDLCGGRMGKKLSLSSPLYLSHDVSSSIRDSWINFSCVELPSCSHLPTVLRPDTLTKTGYPKLPLTVTFQ